ncbi:cation diffusion facilitator family transporter [Dehalobacter sp. DCM]|uniref:cation diffusion facilitator family transporter n=1 Tax=Dehalobacter sp. DCM TaxID=2907827 RepID=UPI0030813826|nr:cation diffusion facilitator family transporter [Dehalobacter sp. DCM]
MQNIDRKVKYALLSVVSNSMLILFKIIAGILSGSVSIISEAIHSGMDLAASIITFFSVRQSSKPADKEHPFGHGKIENISGLAEGLLIFVAAAVIIKEAVEKIVDPGEIEQAPIAIAVMVISAVINLSVSRTLMRVSKEEESMALEADALHLKTDVLTSLGVGVGILLILLTDFVILDSLVAIMVAVLIIKEAYHLCKKAFDFLLDSKLSDVEEAEIERIINQFSDQFRDYHKLKTRKSGNCKHIDFHITLDSEITVKEAHDLVGSLKKAMSDQIKNTRVIIHIDPFEKDERVEIIDIIDEKHDEIE